MLIKKIIIIDDESELLYQVSRHLMRLGFNVFPFENFKDALGEINKDEKFFFVTDYKMPDIDGLNLIKQVREQKKDLPVIIITGYANLEMSIEALRLGVDDIVIKPFSPQELYIRILNVIKKYEIIKENIELKNKIEEIKENQIIGNSNTIKNVIDNLSKIAVRDIPVLIVGESGTGKELIAREIHRRSNRRNAPFIAINSGLINSNIMASELFGHKKGAFTGAISDKVGLIESANGGTLFLDEISNLDIDCQKGLLRFLQEGEIQRVGELKTRKVDVRLITATNQNLIDAIKKGDFREDLYFRINGYCIYVPPLRERKEDIPLLVSHFIRLQNQKYGTNIQGLTNEAMRLLFQYRWPGNVRELKNVIEASCALTTGEYIEASTICQFLINNTKDSISDCVNETMNYNEYIELCEKKYFEKLMQISNHSIKEASKISNLNFTTIYRKIKKYNLTK